MKDKKKIEVKMSLT